MWRSSRESHAEAILSSIKTKFPSVSSQVAGVGSQPPEQKEENQYIIFPLTDKPFQTLLTDGQAQ